VVHFLAGFFVHEHSAINNRQKQRVKRPTKGGSHRKGEAGAVGMGSAMESSGSIDLAVFHSTYHQGHP